MDLSCFSLYLFGFLFFCVFLLKLCRGWVVLLDNSSWMRVGELSEGLGIEDGDSPTHKKRSFKIRNNHSRDQNYLWHYFKQTSKSAPVKNVAVLNWSENEDFTVQLLPLVNFSIKKEIRLFVKHFGINKVHKMFRFLNSYF